MRTASKRTLGVILVVLGLISVLTPFTPFGILLLIGLELLGIRERVVDKVKSWFKKDFDTK